MHIWWIESSQCIHPERYSCLSRAVRSGDVSVTLLTFPQKINYFPRVFELCRKKGLTRCLKRYANFLGIPKLKFFPPSYILPEE